VSSKPNPRFVVITSNNYFSFLTLSRFLPTYRNKIALVIETRQIMRRKGPLDILWNLWKISGTRGLLFKTAPVFFTRVLDVLASCTPGQPRCFGPLSLARRLGIPVVTVRDANSDDCLALLRGLAPDLIFAVNVYQLLKPPLLATPRLGVVNTHFGMLPEYRGMSPYLWAMARGESRVGLTVHFMDEKFDTGAIILQRAVPILPHDSVFAVYVRACLEARSMLLAVEPHLESVGTIPQPSGRTGSYFSLPDRRCLKDLRRRGYRLVTIADLVNVIREAQKALNTALGADHAGHGESVSVLNDRT
jgi:folate-dependent phosphoribosylglycinamide formyltransferase PurN